MSCNNHSCFEPVPRLLDQYPVHGLDQSSRPEIKEAISVMCFWAATFQLPDDPNESGFGRRQQLVAKFGV